MVDRLYENILELIRNSQEHHCNSTLCNLNGEEPGCRCWATVIVIVHYVI